MLRARTLLLGSDHKLAEIAESTGYPNEFYFSRVFTRYWGITPGRFPESRFPASGRSSPVRFPGVKRFPLLFSQGTRFFEHSPVVIILSIKRISDPFGRDLLPSFLQASIFCCSAQSSSHAFRIAGFACFEISISLL